MICQHPTLTAICMRLGHCPYHAFASGWCPGGGKPQPDPLRLIETVTPEGLRARADIVRKVYGDESCARHLELAADRIALADMIFTRLERLAIDLHRSIANAVRFRRRIGNMLRAWRTK